MELEYAGSNPAIKKVVEYMATRNDVQLKPGKNAEEMWKYITDQARKKAVNGSACIEDDVVYGWAVHYFDETNEALKIETKPVHKNVEAKTVRTEVKPEVKKPKVKKESNYEQPTLFDFM